jgi:DNA-binding MarR family transcriptional regulator
MNWLERRLQRSGNFRGMIEVMMPSQSHAELLAAMREFALESDRYVDRAAAVHGLHRTHLNALGFLVSPGPDAPTPGKLGQALNLSSPAVTALVDRLEHSGHVTRQRGQVDRRQVELAMTESARSIGRQLFMPLAARLSQALESYSPEELALVERFLREMTNATAEAKGNLHEDPSANEAL